jgi:hypothetical protein
VAPRCPLPTQSTPSTKVTMRLSLPATLSTLLLGAALSACATTQPLHTEASTAAIRSAEELGAAEVPQAALHLQLAREGLEAATTLNTKGEKERAASWLRRAEADAELAIALTQANDEKKSAQEALDRVRKLQAENPYAVGGTP